MNPSNAFDIVLKMRTHRTIILSVAAAVLLFALAAIFAWAAYDRGYHNGERSVQTDLDRVTVRELIKDVEKIRDQLGRAPFDQAELQSHLGRPMPIIHDDGIMGGRIKVRIYYLRTGDDSFQLTYELTATDDWTYDSTKPEAGWVQSWY